MSTTTSRLAYTSHFELMDRSLASSDGIRVKCEDFGKATRMRLEIYTARKIDREENASIEEEGSPMHGRSIYDILRCVIEKVPKSEACWLYIQKIDLSKMEIEDVAGSGSTNNEGDAKPVSEGRGLVQEPEGGLRR